MSLISDKGFLNYVKDRKALLWAAIILVVAVVCIFIGSGNDNDTAIDGSLESRVSELCRSIDGVGECRVLIYYQPQSSRYDTEKVESVVVVCEGADSIEVRRCLTEMLSSFFGIGSNRVRIEKMRK